MVMMPVSTRLCTAAIHLLLFILIQLLDSAHITTAGAEAAAEVVGGVKSSTIISNNNSQHHSSSGPSLSLSNDYHHHASRPASGSTTVPGGSYNNDALSSSSLSSSSIYDNDERDEYEYSICINCHVVLDIRIVITDNSNNNNNAVVDDDDESNNERRKSTTTTTASTPQPSNNHNDDDAAHIHTTPTRGSSSTHRRIPMPRLHWRVVLHEILPPAADNANDNEGGTTTNNGASTTTTSLALLQPLANAIAHPQQQQQQQHSHSHSHTLSARIVLPYSSFFVGGGGKRDIKMRRRRRREAVVVVSLIREEEDDDEDFPNNNNNNNKKKQNIVNRSLINVVIPNPHDNIVNSDKSRNIRQRSSSSSSSSTMASYYNNIDSIYTTILEDSVPFIDVDNVVLQTKNIDDDDDYNNSSSTEQDVITKVMTTTTTITTTASFETTHEQYYHITTVLHACFYGIIGGSMVLLLFVLTISSSFHNDDERNDNDNNNYLHYDDDDGTVVGTPEPYTHNSDGEYIGPRDYYHSSVGEINDDGMIIIIDSSFYNACNLDNDEDTSSLHNNNDNVPVVDRTTFAGVDSEIDVNIMSSKAKLHINDNNNDDDDDDAPDDNEYEANEGKICLTSPPKIGRMTTVDKNPDSSVPFDPVTTTCYLPTTEVARCITRSCNEKGMIMEHGHELLEQTSSRFQSRVEDARDIDMSEDDIHYDNVKQSYYDVKQSSPRDSSNPSVSSSAITVRAHNRNYGVKRSATEFQNSEDGSTSSSHLSTSITSVHSSDKRQRRQPTTIPARVSTSPTFTPALRESDVGNKDNHPSPNYILDSNEVSFGSNDNISSAGCDSPSLMLDPLTKELSVDDTADRFPSPSSTVAATVHEFANPRRYNNATTYDHPIPIPSGGACQSKRFGISSTSLSISYPDQRFEREPSDNLESNRVNDHARRKRTKQKTRKIESKLHAAMKRVINDKPSSALNDLSRRVEESAWQFSSDEIQINRRNFAKDTTSE